MKVIVFDIIQCIFMLYLFLVVIDINVKMGKFVERRSREDIIGISDVYTTQYMGMLYGSCEHFRSIFYCNINISDIEIIY